MAKILKPYTIIPSELYVQRDADKQVRNIIHDMGRPGYVLVSRQMGKTNLLLNAKRNFEFDNNIFLYIDLSNAFQDAKSCFENIIDTAIETYSNKFKSISEEIYSRRINLNNTPPHKQHTNELRLLLQALEGGKMVIMLDEIDALTKTDYSDQIFSQIRSIYFASRVNFKEFYNLTYLLSGVVEPNEIIKDPKISPFNIGEKIYLNDFSRDEFENFIKTSQLFLETDIKDRIFFWTNGNPRTTWDICSEIENINNEIINVETIDKIVNDLYLTTFDKPPIDNIRELVVKDPEIRNSIIEIEYNKTSEIPDRLKSKLYLAGIINYSERDIHIKNQIIKKSLSLEWIKSIEEEEKGLVGIAIEQFHKQNYSESLNTFEKFLASNTFGNEERSISYYYMGYATYRFNNYEKTIEYLNKTTFDKQDESKLYYRNVNLLGMANYYIGAFDESLSFFKEIIDSGRQDELFVRALLNYGSISLKSDTSKYKDEAEKIFNDIINEIGFDKEKLSSKLIDELKSISHYNLGQIYSDANENETAKRYFVLAFETSPLNIKPTILLSLLDVIEEKSEKIKIINEIINLIIDNNLKPIEDDPEKPIDFNYIDLRNIISQIYLSSDNNIIEKALPLLKLLNDKPVVVQLYELAVYSINNNSKEAGKALLMYIYNYEGDEIVEEIEYKSLKLLSYLYDDENRNFSKAYVHKFPELRFESINYIDFVIFSNLIFRLSSTKQFKSALNYIEIISSLKNEVNEKLHINYLIIYHLELNIYVELNNKDSALKRANVIINLLKDDVVKNYSSNLLGDTGLDIVKQNAENVLSVFNNYQKPVINRKYNRNDIVKVHFISSGIILKTKFKKIEASLNKGECYIIDEK